MGLYTQKINLDVEISALFEYVYLPQRQNTNTRKHTQKIECRKVTRHTQFTDEEKQINTLVHIKINITLNMSH